MLCDLIEKLKKIIITIKFIKCGNKNDGLEESSDKLGEESNGIDLK